MQAITRLQNRNSYFHNNNIIFDRIAFLPGERNQQLNWNLRTNTIKKSKKKRYFVHLCLTIIDFGRVIYYRYKKTR